MPTGCGRRRTTLLSGPFCRGSGWTGRAAASYRWNLGGNAVLVQDLGHGSLPSSLFLIETVDQLVKAVLAGAVQRNLLLALSDVEQEHQNRRHHQS